MAQRGAQMGKILLNAVGIGRCLTQSLPRLVFHALSIEAQMAQKMCSSDMSGSQMWMPAWLFSPRNVDYGSASPHQHVARSLDFFIYCEICNSALTKGHSFSHYLQEVSPMAISLAMRNHVAISRTPDDPSPLYRCSSMSLRPNVALLVFFSVTGHGSLHHLTNHLTRVIFCHLNVSSFFACFLILICCFLFVVSCFLFPPWATNRPPPLTIHR